VVEPSRRSFLTAAAAVMASPTAAIALSDDRDLFDLCREIIRLRGQADEIEIQRVWPCDDEVERILSCGEGTRRERMDRAEVYSIRSGHREAGNEISRLLARADILMERVLAMPANTAAARRAKVEAATSRQPPAISRSSERTARNSHPASRFEISSAMSSSSTLGIALLAHLDDPGWRQPDDDAGR
jgi:hypothetical protein